MSLRNSPTRWGTLSQLLHWLIVALVVAQVTIALVFKSLHREPLLFALVNLHKSIGITIFALMLIRLLWRWGNRVPDLPAALSAYERMLARGTHVALYVILLVMPLTGWLGSAAHGIPVRWFALVTLPGIVAKSLALSKLMFVAHFWLAILLGVIVTVHIAAALRHHLVLRDDTLRRMVPMRTNSVSATGDDLGNR
jgi:cytochrome b561